MDEVAITCSNDSICVWQLRSGSILQTFKNNMSNGFCRSSVNHVLCPQENKSYLHAYTWNKESLVWKAPIPEKLISICTSADGKYCCGGGGSGVVYLWDVYTGELVAQWQSHFNEVLGISFLGAGSEMLVTSGKDSMIHCWILHQVFQTSEPNPFKSWSGHALPVTSLHCTNSRVLSSSLDHTCKIWSVTSEDPISSIIFPSAITCSTMDEGESMIYAGSNDGKIYAVNFLISDSHPIEQVFSGHTKPVTSISVSLDGTRLLSTSLDNTAKLWDTTSFQLIRNFTHHNGPVTCCEITLLPRCLFEDKKEETYQEPFGMFKKYSTLDKQVQKIAVTSSSLPIQISETNTSEELIPVATASNVQEELQSMQLKVMALENQVERWNAVGKQLYQMQVAAVDL